jgi:hypothetical protein
LDNLTEPARGRDLFYFTHWWGYQLVPNIAASSITDYEGLALEYGFFRGRRDAAGRLAYMESWTRDRTDVDLATEIDGQPLGDRKIDYRDNDIATQQVRTFVASKSGSEDWREVPYAETEGQGRFILLRLYAPLDDDGPDSGRPALSAELVDQYISEKAHYSYAADGTLSKIVSYRRDNGFTPVEFVP